MIPNHPRFLEAIHEKKKVSVRFYSTPDNGVVTRICAPLDYGPGNSNSDGLNRYWVWDYASILPVHVLGLVPDQIVELQVLGELFEPAEFTIEMPADPWAVSRHWAVPTSSLATR